MYEGAGRPHDLYIIIQAPPQNRAHQKRNPIQTGLNNDKDISRPADQHNFGKVSFVRHSYIATEMSVHQ